VVRGVKICAGTNGTLTGALHRPENPGKISLNRAARPAVLRRGRHQSASRTIISRCGADGNMKKSQCKVLQRDEIHGIRLLRGKRFG
jgi:hypothetical protein